MLCFVGLSYREALKLVGGLSHVAVHNAFMALGVARSKRKHRCIAVDKAKIELSKKRLYILCARDVHKGGLSV